MLRQQHIELDTQSKRTGNSGTDTMNGSVSILVTQSEKKVSINYMRPLTVLRSVLYCVSIVVGQFITAFARSQMRYVSGPGFESGAVAPLKDIYERTN
jgi:hypothetical protein